MEEFKECGFSTKHLIGNQGTVKRLDQGKIKRYGTDILTGMVKADGYKMYYINNKWHYAHRLVATHYIPNIRNVSDVNHKDGNKANNDFNNLEWLTHSENCQHRYTVLGQASPKGQGSWNYGRKASDQAKLNMSNAKKGWKRNGFSGTWIKI